MSHQKLFALPQALTTPPNNAPIEDVGFVRSEMPVNALEAKLGSNSKGKIARETRQSHAGASHGWLQLGTTANLACNFSNPSSVSLRVINITSPKSHDNDSHCT